MRTVPRRTPLPSRSRVTSLTMSSGRPSGLKVGVKSIQAYGVGRQVGERQAFARGQSRCGPVRNPARLPQA